MRQIAVVGTGTASGTTRCALDGAEARRNGIVHRDVKPGNMFVVASHGQPQRLGLLDFGIARLADELAAELAKLTLPWTGSVPIDRTTSAMPPTTEDPTVAPKLRRPRWKPEKLRRCKVQPAGDP